MPSRTVLSCPFLTTMTTMFTTTTMTNMTTKTTMTKMFTITTTGPYAAQRAAGLNWIVRLYYSLG